MTDEQRKRIHDITYSCDDRAELAERIVRLEDENAKLRELLSLMQTKSANRLDHDKWVRMHELINELGIEVAGE